MAEVGQIGGINTTNKARQKSLSPPASPASSGITLTEKFYTTVKFLYVMLILGENMCNGGMLMTVCIVGTAVVLGSKSNCP